MNELTNALELMTEDAVWTVALVFFRIGAAMAMLPAFGEQVTPMRVKLAASIAFTLIVAPSVWAQVEFELDRRNFMALIGYEVIAGLVIGVMFRLFVNALQIAGTVAAQATSLAQIFGGGLGTEPQPAMSTLLVTGGLCLAVMAGLHVRIAEALILSYVLFPTGNPIAAADLSLWGIRRIANAFALGLSLASPFILASFVYNLALGAINKAMPQLMVAFVGAPAISLGSLVLLVLFAPLMLSLWLKLFLEQTNLDGGAF
ncbi:flagellar biosynthetic protein FliR [Litoreibacter sp.]|nr:flagellar biosynthetic protein FliR [Litoreibacter sp.]